MLYNDAAFDAFFKRAVAAVAPYADSLVCIGGCANALYRHHELAKRPWPAYLGTKDVDWAIPQILPISANAASISERMKQAGFIEDTLGTSAMPVIKYLPADRGLAAEIEFLCPLSGVKGLGNGEMDRVRQGVCSVGSADGCLRGGRVEVAKVGVGDVERQPVGRPVERLAARGDGVRNVDFLRGV